MPRIYTSESDPLDFCKKCWELEFPTEEEAFARFGKLGDGPDERGNCFGYECEHPAYEDEGYECEECKAKLTAKDN
jgi:hypothetical protein